MIMTHTEIMLHETIVESIGLSGERLIPESKQGGQIRNTGLRSQSVPRAKIEIRNDNRPELEAFLEDRLYEFNCKATGICDGELLNASVEDESGNIVAAINGHTWGGCCELLNLWVHEESRGSGLGVALMQAAEQEAVRRGCSQIVLWTHDFQAPGFYEKLGFQRLAAALDYPHGHEKIIYVKRLRD